MATYLPRTMNLLAQEREMAEKGYALQRQAEQDQMNRLIQQVELQKALQPAQPEYATGKWMEGEEEVSGYWPKSDPSKRVELSRGKKSPLVSMDAGETEYQKSLGKGFAEDYRGLLQAGSDAMKNKVRYSRAKSLVEKTKGLTGLGGETRLAAKRLGRLFGMDVGDVGTLEALKGMSVDLTMDVVQKTKGAVSNKEMELFAKTAPGLSNTYEGNILLLEMYEKIADYQQRVSKLARDYARGNKGKFDAGFQDVLDKFHQDNPLFTEDIESRISQAQQATPPPVTPPAPQGGTGLENVSDADLLKGF